MRPSILVLLFLCFVTATAQARPLDLTTARQLALQNQSAIKQRQETLRSRQYQARAASADRMPRLDFKATGNYLRDQPIERFDGLEFPVNDRSIYHYELDLIQPLFTGYALSARQNLAKLEVDLADFDLRQARSDLLLETSLRYLDLLEAGDRLRLADEEHDQLQEHLQDARALFEQGLIPRNDLLKAEVALAQAELQRKKMAGELRLANSRLALLIGLPRRESLQLSAPDLPQPPLLELAELEAGALRKRPEINAARRAIAMAGERLRLEQSRFYPRVSLVGSYQRDGTDILTNDNPYRNRDNASIGLQLDWNLFAAGADRARAIAARHQISAGEQALRTLQDQIRLEVEAALEQLDVARQNQTTAEAALRQARENHRLSTLQFRENLISTSDLLDARTLLTRAETDLQSAHYDYLRALALLRHARGDDAVSGGTS